MITFKKLLAFTSFSVLSLHAFAQSTVNPMPKVGDDWRFSASINAWAPATWVTVTDNKRELSKSTVSSISDNINSAGPMAMFTLEAHRGNWGVLADLVYWQSSGSYSESRPIFGKDNVLYASQNVTMKQTMFTAAGTYTAYNSPSLYLDGLLGARYISSTTSLSNSTQLDHDGHVVTTPDGRKLAVGGNPSSVSQTTNPVVGFKGRARIMDSSWFIPFYADMGKGPGPNNGTWQALLGVGDAFSWGDVTLAYRAMGFHLNSNTGTTNYTNAGPQLSATINF
jgi:hypothetical protein